MIQIMSRNRTRLFAALATVIAIGLGIALVLALTAQEDATTGSVSVVGEDMIAIAPTADWVEVVSLNGAAESGNQPLVFTNSQDFDVLITKVVVAKIPSSPSVLDGTMTLEMGEEVASVCPDPATFVLPLNSGIKVLGLTVPATGSMTLCGNLLYDGSLVATNADLDFTFTFFSEPAPAP